MPALRVENHKGIMLNTDSHIGAPGVCRTLIFMTSSKVGLNTADLQIAISKGH